MKLTIVGCAGSFPGPDSAASCYLVQAPFEGGTFNLVLDLGSGSFGVLQRHLDPRDVGAVALSHLHADHCFDMSGFYVVGKYHPDGAFDRVPVLAPEDADEFLTDKYGREDPAGFGGVFDFREWVDGESVQLGPFTVTARRVVHPVPAFAMRVEAGGKVLVYSGDTAATPILDDLAAGADLFLCEASFVDSKENPPGIHLTGSEVGDSATAAGVGRVVLTHIPTWTDVAEVESDLRRTWSGAYDVAVPGAVYDV